MTGVPDDAGYPCTPAHPALIVGDRKRNVRPFGRLRGRRQSARPVPARNRRRVQLPWINSSLPVYKLGGRADRPRATRAIWRRSSISVITSVESCRKSLSMQRALAGHTTARTGFPKITEKRQAKACPPPPDPSTYEGSNGVFSIRRGHSDTPVAPTKLCQGIDFPLTVTLVR